MRQPVVRRFVSALGAALLALSLAGCATVAGVRAAPTGTSLLR